MRQFVVVGHEAPTEPFGLEDLPGAGRVDLLARCVSAGIFLSHDIREDVRVHLVLADALTVSFDGATLRHLHPDERNVAARISGALEQKAKAIGHLPAEPSPGVELYRTGLAETLDRLDGPVVQLHEAGTPVPEAELPADPVFVLSDHQSFSVEDETTIADRRVGRVSVAPVPIHANHAVAVVHNYLDTAGYERY